MRASTIYIPVLVAVLGTTAAASIASAETAQKYSNTISDHPPPYARNSEQPQIDQSSFQSQSASESLAEANRDQVLSRLLISKKP